jgi:hypothetical protein
MTHTPPPASGRPIRTGLTSTRPSGTAVPHRDRRQASGHRQGRGRRSVGPRATRARPRAQGRIRCGRRRVSRRASPTATKPGSGPARHTTTTASRTRTASPTAGLGRRTGNPARRTGNPVSATAAPARRTTAPRRPTAGLARPPTGRRRPMTGPGNGTSPGSRGRRNPPRGSPRRRHRPRRDSKPCHPPHHNPPLHTPPLHPPPDRGPALRTRVPRRPAGSGRRRPGRRPGRDGRRPASGRPPRPDGLIPHRHRATSAG